MTDSDLLESIRNDNEKAFSELFYRYSSRIYAKAWSYIRDKEVCEQIVHDLFLTVWTNRKTLKMQSVIGYLSAAARYQVYKHIAASKIMPIDYKENLEDWSTLSVENVASERLALDDLEAELDVYLQGLPKRCREIFIMSRKQILSNEEIAKRLGISKRSVENQITQALKYLRVSLKHISVLFAFLLFY